LDEHRQFHAQSGYPELVFTLAMECVLPIAAALGCVCAPCPYSCGSGDDNIRREIIWFVLPFHARFSKEEKEHLLIWVSAGRFESKGILMKHMQNPLNSQLLECAAIGRSLFVT
jgi:hypothetical protein